MQPTMTEKKAEATTISNAPFTAKVNWRLLFDVISSTDPFFINPDMNNYPTIGIKRPMLKSKKLINLEKKFPL